MRQIKEELPLTGAEIDTLVALVENGPLDSGSVPSKAGRYDLIERGYAFFTVVKGEQGYTAVTPAGVEAYKRHFGSALQAEGEKIEELRLSEVTAHRKARSGINKAFYRPNKDN
jgi:hypothetical protein